MGRCRISYVVYRMSYKWGGVVYRMLYIVYRIYREEGVCRMLYIVCGIWYIVYGTWGETVLDTDRA